MWHYHITFYECLSNILPNESIVDIFLTYFKIFQTHKKKLLTIFKFILNTKRGSERLKARIFYVGVKKLKSE